MNKETGNAKLLVTEGGVIADTVVGETNLAETQMHISLLREALYGAVTSALVIGYELNWFKENKRYQDLNYFTFEEFANSEFKMARATAHNYIKVAEKFGVPVVEEGSVRTQMKVKENLAGYGFSQLIELAKIDDEKRENLLDKINPNISVRDIKIIINNEKNAHEDSAKKIPDKKITIEGDCWEDIISDDVQRQVEEALAVQDYVPHIAIAISYKKQG